MSIYERLKAGCLKKKELFEDPDFPASQASIFYHQTPPFQFVWKRPKDLCPDPLFVDDAPDKLPLAAGKLGDPWFVSCVGCLASTRGLFYRVVPADQTFSSPDYAGLFRFRIWWCGEWKEVVVDDQLPTVSNKLMFVHGANTFWPCLLEKAYAKLHGSYEALKYGTSLDCLADLTGGITESVSVGYESVHCAKVINKLLKMTTVVTAITQRQMQQRNAAEKLPNGILAGINYRVVELQKVQTKDFVDIILVWLRKPLYIDSEYKGQCEEYLHEIKDINIRLGNDQFCMPLDEFVTTFTTLEIVHLDGDTSRAETSLKSRDPWHVKLWHGHWQKGVNAGGCRNHSDTFHVNPQMQLIVGEAQDMVICLSQHIVLEPRVIGFSVYQMSKPTSDVLGKSFFKINKSILNSPYSNSRQVSVRCHLEQGYFVLLPTTFEPCQEANYTLRVLSTKPIRMKLLDCIPSSMKPAIIQAPITNDKISSYEAVFLRLADEHKTISAFELLELLETCLPNDYVKSCATLEVCRQIILALDKSGSGRLKYQDYKNLMCSLKLWQTIFRSHSKGSSGILRAEKLRGALMDVGFQVNIDALSLLVLRYMRKDGTLRFGDFVLCILHLMVAFGTFEKKDLLQNGFVKTTLSEWLQASLQC
ncbi:calpain-C-like isoform X1 [Argiope bruennichi]|uniref:calpain-C-like isoform X1 n=1 Tax=Argiope bruennichi TaxID=94029 RepID=UPI0024941794|nr:calpain-C-like isoform X1 [Argiope bruennichi]